MRAKYFQLVEVLRNKLNSKIKFREIIKMLQDSYNHLPITLLRLRNNAMKFYSRIVYIVQNCRKVGTALEVR